MWTRKCSNGRICAVFISDLLTSNGLKKFKHTNEELELARMRSEKEKKKQDAEASQK